MILINQNIVYYSVPSIHNFDHEVSFWFTLQIKAKFSLYIVLSFFRGTKVELPGPTLIRLQLTNICLDDDIWISIEIFILCKC